MNQPGKKRSARPASEAFQLKVNAREGWAHCGLYRRVDYELVAAACRALAICTTGTLVFKTLNEEGFVIERIGSDAS